MTYILVCVHQSIRKKKKGDRNRKVIKRVVKTLKLIVKSKTFIFLTLCHSTSHLTYKEIEPFFKSYDSCVINSYNKTSIIGGSLFSV